jgi:transglutaminase-like putative cysteine protease
MYLHAYEGGRWIRNQFGFQSADRANSPPGLARDLSTRLPNFGPGTWHLTYTLHTKQMRSAPLADPVAWRSGQMAPVASIFEDETYRSWIHKHDGSMDGSVGSDHGPPKYVQAWTHPEFPGHSPVMRIQPSFTNYLLRLPRGMARVKAYTDRLVERLVADGILRQDVLTDVNEVGNRRQQHHAAVAQALERHLAASGEFTYTLDLTRQDRNVDPVEDFLLNTRSGHCQRFATALVLMLRTQGIPAQMVVGYRGCIGRGDGWYDVREDHAHAWVEVLLPASDESLPPIWSATVAPTLGIVSQVQAVSMAGGSMAVAALPLPQPWQPMRWVTLDPTPGAPADDSVAATLLEQARQKWGAVAKALLLAYNRDSRQQAVEAIESWLTQERGWMYVTGAALALILLIAWRRQTKQRAAILASYPEYVRRMAAILAPYGFKWRNGQTAREYALEVAAGLGALPTTADAADVPLQIAATYYAERFGGRQLNGDDIRELNAILERLRVAVKSPGFSNRLPSSSRAS